MLIKRNRIDFSKLYFISSLDNLNGDIIGPRVPNNFLVSNKIGDYKTKRVCFYPSIDKALISLSSFQELSGKKFYIYRPRNINFDSLYKPNISEVPNCFLTDEYWYLKDVEIRYITSITVKDKEEELSFRYGPRSTKVTVYRWNWKEDLNYWEDTKL